MNSFAHVLPYLDRDPHFAIGCALPDWLGAVDRKCRVRRAGASKFTAGPDQLASEIASGIIQHIDDDRWFHSTATFSALSIEFSVELREQLSDDPGFRPGFLGHIIIELLLDAYLHAQFPAELDSFYRLVEKVNPHDIENAVNQMATRPTNKLTRYFEVFLKERYLYDYAHNDRLLYRLNFVLRRVKLNPVGDEILDWISDARQSVYSSAKQLLNSYEIDLPNGK